MKYCIESDEIVCLRFYFCTRPLVSLPRETLDRQEQQQDWRALEGASEEMKGADISSWRRSSGPGGPRNGPRRR